MENLGLPVAKVNMVVVDPAGDRGQGNGARTVANFRLDVQHFEDSLTGHHRRLQHVVLLTEIADWLEKAVDQSHEEHKLADRQRLTEDELATKVHGRRRGDGAKQRDNREKER